MIAVLTAVILPFIVEVIEKIIKVDVIIEPRKFNHIKDVKDEKKKTNKKIGGKRQIARLN